jgi:endonuclease/exonuclease/phosphatase family metal-dependent hydrolase
LPELVVVVWNLHWGRGRFAPGRGVPFDVVEPLRAADADVCVLPEHFRTHDGVGLVDPLCDDGYEILELQFARVSFRDRPRVATPGDGWWTLAVATRLPVLDQEQLPLGRGIHDPAGARAALRVGLDVDGTRVDLVGLHVSSKLWWANPVRHLLGLRPHLRDLRDHPTVVAGDCNLWGPPVERLLPGWRRAVRGRTYPGFRPHSQIDHVLVNEHVQSCGGEILGRTPSDHRAVRARLLVQE